MELENRKSFLELKVIWKDDDMIELSIMASNLNFYGKTQVYVQPESLLEFSKLLIGFPEHDKTLFYEMGERDSYAYFSMRYYKISTYGPVGVEINIESNVATEFREEEKSKVKLEIIVEPNSIDNFQRELLNLTDYQTGSAILYGRDNRI